MFYGSQTGTAEEYATRLAKEATRHGMPAMTFDPEECTDWVNTFSNFMYFSVKSVFLLVESSAFCILDVLIFVWVASYPFGVCVYRKSCLNLALTLRALWPSSVWLRMGRGTLLIMHRNYTIGSSQERWTSAPSSEHYC